MNKTLLISFVGKGRPRANDSPEYDLIEYIFDGKTSIKTRVFGVALFNYLKDRHKIDILFVGTKGSSWAQLRYISEDENLTHEALEALIPLFDLEKTSSVDEESLGRFLKAIGEMLNTNIHFLLLNSPPIPEEISTNFYKKLEELFSKASYEKVILDITHGFRYMPYVVLLCLIAYKKLIPFEVEIYYGFGISDQEDMNKPKEVSRLKHLEELLRLGEALGTLEASGDFRAYFKVINEENSDATEIYFNIETNSPVSLRRLRRLKTLEKIHDWVEDLHKIVAEKYISPLEAETLYDRLRNRARFFFERGQYLKATLLIHEAILVLIGMRKGLLKSSALDYRGREEALNIVKNLNIPSWNLLRYLRNACAHGTEPNNPSDPIASKAREARMNEEEFKKALEEAFRLYEDIKSGQINLGG